MTDRLPVVWVGVKWSHVKVVINLRIGHHTTVPVHVYGAQLTLPRFVLTRDAPAAIMLSHSVAFFLSILQTEKRNQNSPPWRGVYLESL